MKATGIVRRIDDLGRVVIPREARRMIGIQEGDALEIFVDEGAGGLMLVPYFSEAPDRIRAVAESLNTMGHNPEEWKIAEELKKIAEKLKKTLDKYPKVCYNIPVLKKRVQTKKERERKIYASYNKNDRKSQHIS